MKYFVHILLLFPLCAVAQNNTNHILSAPAYKRGIYLTFEEFRSNSPALLDDFVFDGSSLWLVDSLHQKTREIKKQETWGFCDGRQVYIYWHTYNSLTEMGRFCYFQELDKPPFPLTILSFLVPRSNELMVSFNTGKVYVLTKKVMRNLLREDDKELLARFEAEKHKKKKFHQYVVLYNQRNSFRIK